MNLLPKASGNRPRLACEIAPGGVVAARSPGPGMPLAAVAKAELAEAAVVPSLKPGNIADRVAVIASLRRTLEQVGGRPNARKSDMTLIVPDGAVRVLLLDFDALPSKLSEALPLVRFRLKKLVPFEPDDAMVSFQVMSSSRTAVRVLAVAIPRDVLSEYESLAREAGFEPGSVLPSTLAALAGLNEGEGASLIVNAHSTGVTTAIVRAGIVLLHRTIELTEPVAAAPANLPPALFEPTAAVPDTDFLRTRDADDGITPQISADFGRSPYGDGARAEAAVQNQDGVPGYGEPPVAMTDDVHLRRAQAYSNAASEGFYDRDEPAPVEKSPYAGPTVPADLNAELHHAILVAPTSLGTLTDPAAADDLGRLAALVMEDEATVPVHTLTVESQAGEIASAVSVAVAYFEDTLGAAPPVLLSAGPLGAEALNRMLREQGVAEADGVRVREMIDPSALSAEATTVSVPRSWLGGVVGALKT